MHHYKNTLGVTVSCQEEEMMPPVEQQVPGGGSAFHIPCCSQAGFGVCVHRLPTHTHWAYLQPCAPVILRRCFPCRDSSPFHPQPRRRSRLPWNFNWTCFPPVPAAAASPSLPQHRGGTPEQPLPGLTLRLSDKQTLMLKMQWNLMCVCAHPCICYKYQNTRGDILLVRLGWGLKG